MIWLIKGRIFQGWRLCDWVKNDQSIWDRCVWALYNDVQNIISTLNHQYAYDESRSLLSSQVSDCNEAHHGQSNMSRCWPEPDAIVFNLSTWLSYRRKTSGKNYLCDWPAYDARRFMFPTKIRNWNKAISYKGQFSVLCIQYTYNFFSIREETVACRKYHLTLYIILVTYISGKRKLHRGWKEIADDRNIRNVFNFFQYVKKQLHVESITLRDL